MKTIELNDASAPLSEYARNLGSEPLLLTAAGRTVAALMPVDDEDVDRLSLASNPKFVAILESARAQRRAGQGLSSEEVRRELGLAGS
jgi:hypothetical protein